MKLQAQLLAPGTTSVGAHMPLDRTHRQTTGQQAKAVTSLGDEGTCGFYALYFYFPRHRIILTIRKKLFFNEKPLSSEYHPPPGEATPGAHMFAPHSCSQLFSSSPALQCARHLHKSLIPHPTALQTKGFSSHFGEEGHGIHLSVRGP